MEKVKRLFIGIELPEELKLEIAEKFLEKIPKEKWRKVKPENLHITLRFLGYLNEKAVEELKKKLGNVKFDSFEATLKGCGHFKGKILWIGVGTGAEELIVLSKKINDALGLVDERFHPHVTLARNKGMKRKETDELIERLRNEEFEKTIQVNGFELFESKLEKSGPKYFKLFSFSF